MVRIVLWGPPRCGKSWFLHSLSRAVATLNDDLNGAAELRLSSAATDTPVFSSAPPPAPTTEAYDRRWRLTWRATPPNRLPLAQTGDFLISDHAGDALISLGHAGQDVAAYRQLQEADAVIALVNAAALQSDGGAAVYKGCLPTLFDLLARRASRRPLLLALVVAQADRLPPQERDEPAEALLVRRFALPEASAGLAVRAFLCSAAGFLDDDHRLANMDGNRLRDSSSWTPWRVHEPLLASLEGEERYRLRQGGSAVGRFLFARRRLAAYERDSLHALLRAHSQGA